MFLIRSHSVQGIAAFDVKLKVADSNISMIAKRMFDRILICFIVYGLRRTYIYRIAIRLTVYCIRSLLIGLYDKRLFFYDLFIVLISYNTLVSSFTSISDKICCVRCKAISNVGQMFFSPMIESSPAFSKAINGWACISAITTCTPRRFII